MDAEALRAALAGGNDTDSSDDDDDPVTAAGRRLAPMLKLDEEGLDALTDLIAAVAAEGR
jgi:hypothetical protein